MHGSRVRVVYGRRRQRLDLMVEHSSPLRYNIPLGASGNHAPRRPVNARLLKRKRNRCGQRQIVKTTVVFDVISREGEREREREADVTVSPDSVQAFGKQTSIDPFGVLALSSR